MLPPEQENDRIASVYASKEDGELAELAASAFELSEVAQSALRAEISRRGLNVPIAEPPGYDVYELNQTVTLRQFRDLPEALLAKGSLESAGIQAYLFDDNMVRMDWFYSNLVGGIKLKVRPEDVDAAEDILRQPIPESFDVEGVGEYAQPACPECKSLDIGFEELNKLASYGSAYLGVPIPVQKKTWTCHACGAEWKDPSDTDPKDTSESTL